MVFGSGGESLEFHHIYPRAYLKNLGISEPDLVANLTILTAPANQSLRDDDDPAAVGRRQDVIKSAVETHAVTWNRFKTGKWNELVEDRSAKITTLIKEVTA